MNPILANLANLPNRPSEHARDEHMAGVTAEKVSAALRQQITDKVAAFEEREAEKAEAERLDQEDRLLRARERQSARAANDAHVAEIQRAADVRAAATPDPDLSSAFYTDLNWTDAGMTWRSAPVTGTLPADRIDAVAGVIRGVSVLQAVEARGHGVMADDVLLGQVAHAINTSAGGVKSRLAHPTETRDGIGWMVGKFKNAAVQGDKVVADLHLAQHAKKSPNGDLWSYVVAAATETPESFGASISFISTLSWRMADGSESPAQRDPKGAWIRPEGTSSPMPVARLKTLRAIDIVDTPAANPGGLFSADPAEALNFSTPPIKDHEMDLKTLKALRDRHPGHSDLILDLSADGKTEGEIEAAVTAKTITDLKAAQDKHALDLKARDDKAAADLKAAQDKAAADLAAKEKELTDLRAKATALEKLGKAPTDPGGSDASAGAGETPAAALEKQWAEDAEIRKRFSNDKSVFMAFHSMSGQPYNGDGEHATAWHARPLQSGTIGLQPKSELVANYVYKGI